MIEEIKKDNNCIIKAFENNPISILHENIDNKKVYYFKAIDIGIALHLTNIRASIQNYDEDEHVLREVYDLRGCLQKTTFLTSQGVYRLLYNSKKETAKKFRKWAGNILDDIIFNESKELIEQLKKSEEQLQIKENELQKNEELLEVKENELQKNKELLEKKDIEIQNLEDKPETEGFIRKEGYIYIIIDSDKPGHKKIGSCGLRHLDKRLSALNVGSSEYSLKTSHTFKTFDVNLVEEMVHRILQPFRIRGRNEWFYTKNNFEANYIINTIKNCIQFTNKYNIKDYNHLNTVARQNNKKEQIINEVGIINEEIVEEVKIINEVKIIKKVEIIKEEIEQDEEIKEVQVKRIYKGVIWTKSKNKWKACLIHNKKNYHLGYFIDELDAVVAYNDYGLYLNKKFNYEYVQHNIENYIPNPRNIPEENKEINKRLSEYIGVRFISARNNYSVFITVNNKTKIVGYNKVEIEAAKMYDQQALFYNNTQKAKYILNNIPGYIIEQKDIRTENKNIKLSNKTSKYVGVFWLKDSGEWKTQLVYNKVTLYLGTFTSELDAAKIYNQQALYLNNEKKRKYVLNDLANYITEPRNIYNEKHNNKLI